MIAFFLNLCIIIHRARSPLFFYFFKFKRPGGEIGIHERLKISWPRGRAGSSPAPGTNIKYRENAVFLCLCLGRARTRHDNISLHNKSNKFYINFLNPTLRE